METWKSESKKGEGKIERERRKEEKGKMKWNRDEKRERGYMESER